ncbi:TetR/AcrR family transcriptional regulator [Neptunicoccus cionae]|uniref:TetR family transcriptional regulator n=1 Tax=Neptunicoccus cionae TaxID=2035344 RepID=A0A916VSH4_9RHOB|nr:TetR family transcriptional regulator C-terminal domain-containing protein [Amylibacter cionae]GGA26751.1 TetR family transcriptional regulator [Amylibacter cionae]
MSESRPKFRRESAAQRKEALIHAALDLISEQGIGGATVRAIAQRADVTQGLIRHYFSSKEELIAAAYEFHMDQMTELTATPVATPEVSASHRLGTFVAAGLTSPVMDTRSVTLWASFISSLRNDDDMRAMHQRTYYNFRNRLEALIADALSEAGTPATKDDLRRMAIAANAVIDGLWMEGGALPEAFETGELARIGLRSVGAIIGLNLTPIMPTQTNQDLLTTQEG